MFLGAPSTERHDHHDADGNLTGHTIVTRDSDWDEDSRQAAFALHEDKTDRCPDCGQLIEECSDPSVDYYPQLARCYHTAARLRAARAYEKKHEKDVPLEGSMALPTDGTSVWVSRLDLSPDDNFI